MRPGYGPHLGPLVLTATVWEVPGRWPKKTDFWKTFAQVAQREVEPATKESRRKVPRSEDRLQGGAAAEESPEQILADELLHIADSKAVYCPAIGLGLTHGALAAFGVASRVPADFDELLDELLEELTDESPADAAANGRGRELWFRDDFELPLPLSPQGVRSKCGREMAKRLRSNGGAAPRHSQRRRAPAAGTRPPARPTTRRRFCRGCT